MFFERETFHARVTLDYSSFRISNVSKICHGLSFFISISLKLIYFYGNHANDPSHTYFRSNYIKKNFFTFILSPLIIHTLVPDLFYLFFLTVNFVNITSDVITKKRCFPSAFTRAPRNALITVLTNRARRFRTRSRLYYE